MYPKQCKCKIASLFMVCRFLCGIHMQGFIDTMEGLRIANIHPRSDFGTIFHSYAYKVFYQLLQAKFMWILYVHQIYSESQIYFVIQKKNLYSYVSCYYDYKVYNCDKQFCISKKQSILLLLINKFNSISRSYSISRSRRKSQSLFNQHRYTRHNATKMIHCYN